MNTTGESETQKNSNGRTQVIVATSVMLSFITFWRAAAIVLNDLGSSAYYVGGIAEKAIGRAAPWFILAVMLFSYAVRAIYVESCAMFRIKDSYEIDVSDSWLYAAMETNLPIFVPGWEDSTLGNMYAGIVYELIRCNAWSKGGIRPGKSLHCFPGASRAEAS